MKTTIEALTIGMILTSLVSCGPAVPLAAGATEPRQGTVVPVSATQISTENQATGVPRGQAPLADESAESVKLARQDLAQRLGLSAESVTVSAVIGQEFSTDAFNCRTSKERIAKDPPPASVTGLSILLSAAGRRYEYHASGLTVLFCRRLP